MPSVLKYFTQSQFSSHMPLKHPEQNKKSSCKEAFRKNPNQPPRTNYEMQL